MGKYILKRILYMIPLTFMVIVCVFLIMSFTPGDPATNNLPITALPEVKEAYNISVGYTGSLFTRFMNYLKGLFSGNVISYSSRENIFKEIGIRLPYTVRVGLPAFLLSSIIGISLGILSAVKQYSFVDSVVTITAVFFGSIPVFLLGTLLILIFSVKLKLLPTSGIDAGFRSYIMPVAAMTICQIPTLTRMTRSSMLSVMNQDYVRTARAKGCDEKRVIWKHVLKNASLPLITILVGGLAGVVGGSVFVERTFSIPGVGTYMLNAMNGKNVPVVLTVTLMMSGVYMLAMLMMDISYALIDPKIASRYKGQ